MRFADWCQPAPWVGPPLYVLVLKHGTYRGEGCQDPDKRRDYMRDPKVVEEQQAYGGPSRGHFYDKEHPARPGELVEVREPEQALRMLAGGTFTTLREYVRTVLKEVGGPLPPPDAADDLLATLPVPKLDKPTWSGGLRVINAGGKLATSEEWTPPGGRSMLPGVVDLFRDMGYSEAAIDKAFDELEREMHPNGRVSVRRFIGRMEKIRQRFAPLLSNARAVDAEQLEQVKVLREAGWPFVESNARPNVDRVVREFVCAAAILARRANVRELWLHVNGDVAERVAVVVHGAPQNGKSTNGRGSHSAEWPETGSADVAARRPQ